MKKGDTYKNFGCIWVIDSIYELTDEYMRENWLFHKTRYKAHVIKAPADYIGIREIDAPYIKTEN